MILLLGVALGPSGCAQSPTHTVGPEVPPECSSAAREALDGVMRRAAALSDVVPGAEAGPEAEEALAWLQGSPDRPLGGLAGRDFETRWMELGCSDEDELQVLDAWRSSFDEHGWQAERQAADERGATRFPVGLSVPAQLMLRHASLELARSHEPEGYTTEGFEELGPGPDGVVFRIHLPDGDPEGVTLLADGTVVALLDSGVDAGRDGIVQWRVDDATRDEVVALVLDPDLLAGLDPPPPTGAAPTGGELANMAFGGCCAVGLPSTLARAAVDLLSDAEGHVEPSRPFVPSTLPVRARRADTADGAPRDLVAAQPWPLERSIVELGQVADGVTGGSVLHLCLQDEEAASIWDLLGPGTNRAWLAVVDDGATWYLDVSLWLPGFTPAFDRCHAAGGEG